MTGREGKGEGQCLEVAVFKFGTSPGWPKAFLILNGGFWKQGVAIARPLTYTPSSLSFLGNCSA